MACKLHGCKAFITFLYCSRLDEIPSEFNLIIELFSWKPVGPAAAESRHEPECSAYPIQLVNNLN